MLVFRSFQLFLAAILFGLAGCSETPVEPKQVKNPETRVVTLGGDVTEIVYRLGAGESVVGVDQSSSYPIEVLDLPRLNYHRQISAEGVLSLEPDLVLIAEGSGPPGAIDQLRSATEVKMIPGASAADEVPDKMIAVAEALGRKEAGEQIVAKYQAEMEEISAMVAELDDRPRVIFLYARQGLGAPMVGGRDSGADAMIELAGGVNGAESISQFKPLTPEALVEFDPDCILMMSKGLEAIGGAEGLLAIPGMEATRAGKSKNFVAIEDDLLLSFGPRTPEAVRRLASALHPGKLEAK